MTGPERVPLSFQQEGLWVDVLRRPGNGFTLTRYLTLDRDPGLEVLRAAIGAVADRQEALRTTFTPATGPPAQLLHTPGPDPVVVLADDQQVRRRLTVPLDPVAAPPWWVALTPLPGGRAAVTLAAHHLVTDDRSMDVWAEELRLLLTGGDQALPRLTVQYGDYAVWQRGWVDEPEQQSALRQRVRELATGPLSSGLPRDVAARGAGRERSRRLVPPAVVQALRGLGRSEAATGVMVWGGLLAEVLGSRSGLDRVLLGCLADGRGRSELFPLIGCFAGVVVLDVARAGGPREACAAGRMGVVEGLRYADLPLPRLVAGLNPRRDTGTAPLVQVGLSVTAGPAVTGPDDGTDRGPAFSPFDLDIAVTDLPDGGQGVAATFRADVYTRPTVDALLGELVRLAEQAAKDGAGGWRRRGPSTVLDSPAGRRLDRLVDAVAARSPDAPAVRCDDEELSYRGLLARAAAVHAALAAEGLAAGENVGLLADRSVDLLSAILGIWRAGAVYVPLDPGYPEARLRDMVSAGRTRVVLCDADQVATAERLGAHPVAVPSMAVADAPDPAADDPHVPAYVMFTSGSTGRPKGVVVDHASVEVTLLAVAEKIGLVSEDLWLAVTPTSFDISVLELIGPLLVGATVVIADRRSTRDGEALVSLARRSGATVLQATPATWRMVVAADPDGDLPVAVLCGGEALPADLADRLRGRGRGQWNLYGPTEATIWASAWRLPTAPGAPVRIGRALASATLHVMDDQLRPVATGETGELVISGPCIARGYLDDPELTAARFPRLPVTGGRGYRTGDLVRERPDGLEFLGRRDDQVKVRGHRVELGEVEVVLRRHPRVADAVAAVRRDASGEHELVVFVRADPAVTREELVAVVAAELPAHAVPTSWHAVKEVPLTPSGKVDRQTLLGSSLPRLASEGRGGSTTARAAEVTAVSSSAAAAVRAVAAVCEDLLGRSDISPDDDFFALGGHSLLMLQLMAALRQSLGVRVPLRDLFDAPTVAGIAASVERHGSPSAGATDDVPELVPVPRD